MQINKKVCACCLEEKMPYDFYRNRRYWDGLHNRCKECMKKNHKKSEIEKLRKIVPADYPWNP